MVKSLGGYYEEEEFNSNERFTYYNLKVRVPCSKFESLLSATEKVPSGKGEELSAKTINTRDITEEYFDTKLRLENKQNFRKRYTELLSSAGKVSDILAIQENIRVLQEEIESKEGRLRYLDDQITYSTLDINLHHPLEQSVKEEVPETFMQQVSSSIGNGYENLINLCLWCIKQWPWLILILASIFSFKIYLKKKRR